MMIASAGLALAQGAAGQAPTAPAGDAAQVKGSVKQCLLNPRGAVDGLIQADGTEVRLPAHASTRVLFLFALATR